MDTLLALAVLFGCVIPLVAVAFVIGLAHLYQTAPPGEWKAWEGE